MTIQWLLLNGIEILYGDTISWGAFVTIYGLRLSPTFLYSSLRFPSVIVFPALTTRVRVTKIVDIFFSVKMLWPNQLLVPRFQQMLFLLLILIHEAISTSIPVISKVERQTLIEL